MVESLHNNEDSTKLKEKRKIYKELDEAFISQKKAYDLFSDKKEYAENDYDSENDEDFLIKFDEELDFKKDIKGVDIAILLDTTGSMNSYLKSCKIFIRKLIRDAIRCITQYNYDSNDFLRVGLVCYRDHPPEGKSYGNFTLDFTHEIFNFKEVLKSITAKGGGDEAEAVVDGLDEVANTLTWREDSEKFVFHILDAPPHGNEYGSLKDAFPDGCPCGKDVQDILKDLRDMNVDYTIINLDKSIEKMIEIFSEVIEVDVLSIEMEKSNKDTDQSG